MTKNQNNPLVKNRVRSDDRLDHLYMTEMRCPYCQTKMPKGTSKCKNCALTKEQIYQAKLTVPYGKNNILMSKVRPVELSYGKMVTGSVFGFLGLHCFFSKRFIRGIVLILLTVAAILSFVIFPSVHGETPSHPVRRMIEEKGMLFPGDLIGIIVLGMWVWDFFAVTFGQFKYPVVPELGEEEIPV